LEIRKGGGGGGVKQIKDLKTTTLGGKPNVHSQNGKWNKQTEEDIWDHCNRGDVVYKKLEYWTKFHLEQEKAMNTGLRREVGTTSYRVPGRKRYLQEGDGKSTSKGKIKL